VLKLKKKSGAKRLIKDVIISRCTVKLKRERERERERERRKKEKLAVLCNLNPFVYTDIFLY